uniref:Evasin n=1 Tax=Rhipicephalus appendiculatus TaxID=34631 RepID=A0A131YY14_RHIAP
MAAFSLRAIVVLMMSARLMPAAAADTSGDCSPVFLTTHGKPIQAGCGTTCETGGMKATARQTGQECTNVSADLARKMQPFLGYMCPVGWCGAEGCVLSGLTLECWYASTARSASKKER